MGHVSSIKWVMRVKINMHISTERNYSQLPSDVHGDGPLDKHTEVRRSSDIRVKVNPLLSEKMQYQESSHT